MLAMKAELDEDLTRAEECFVARTDQSPSSPFVWQDLGCFHLRNGRLGAAEDAFRQMLLGNFTNFNGLLLNGYVQLELEEYEKAGTFFEAAVLMYPNSALAWCTLGIYNEIKPALECGTAAVATERAYTEAKRASGLEESDAKKYELFLEAVRQQCIFHPFFIYSKNTTSLFTVYSMLFLRCVFISHHFNTFSLFLIE